MSSSNEYLLSKYLHSINTHVGKGKLCFGSSLSTQTVAPVPVVTLMGLKWWSDHISYQVRPPLQCLQPQRLGEKQRLQGHWGQTVKARQAGRTPYIWGRGRDQFPFPTPVPWGQHPPSTGLGCCPALSLGLVAELLNGLKDPLHMAHFGDPQVLQERERGGEIFAGGISWLLLVDKPKGGG